MPTSTYPGRGGAGGAGADDIITVTPKRAIRLIVAMIRIGRPVLMQGPPGGGKSSIVRQAVDLLSEADGEPWGLVDQRLSQLSDVDLLGLPAVEDGLTIWARPAWLPREGKGVLFLDEMTRALPQTLNAGMQLLLDRCLGPHPLGSGWAQVGASNMDGDDAGVHKLYPAVANRLVRLYLKTDLADWCEWAVTHNIHPMTIAYVRWKPDRLHAYDRNASSFPSPRSWEFVSDITHANLPPDDELPLVAGCIGKPDAVDYLTFSRMYRALPNIDSILLNPDTAAIPATIDSQYATASALAQRATVQNFASILRYLARWPSREYSVFAVKDATARDESLTLTTAFTTWAVQNQDVL